MERWAETIAARRDVVGRAPYQRISGLCAPTRALAIQPHCPIHAIKRLCTAPVSLLPREAAKLLHFCGAFACFAEWEDTACQISSCYAKESILATGSAGAACTDTFIDITLQEQEITLRAESGCKARGSPAPGRACCESACSSVRTAWWW
jgi:hypothetical protein